MVNLNSSNNDQEGEGDVTEEKLIWRMKVSDYLRKWSRGKMGRVHVLCCHQCDFLTISLRTLQKHMIILHHVRDPDFRELDMFSCQLCRCTSTESKLIQEHIRIFHGTPPRTHQLFDGDSIKITKTSSPLIGRRATHESLGNMHFQIRDRKIRRRTFKKRNNNVMARDFGENKQDGEMMDDEDPLDMSMKSTTCPFKSSKNDSWNSDNPCYPEKQGSTQTDDFYNTDHNSSMSNSLLSYPETCIELIKLTLSQILNKTKEQNDLSHIEFNPSSFLQSQPQVPSCLIPLFLSTSSHNGQSAQTQSQDDTTSISKDIETIITNIKHPNCFQSSSPTTLEQSNQMMEFQPLQRYLNHKVEETSSMALKGMFVASTKKNGNHKFSALSSYNSKKSMEYRCKTLRKKGLKKQAFCPVVQRDLEDEEEDEFLRNKEFDSPKFDMENLFNRSFLASSETESFNDQMDLTNVFQVQNSFESNKKSPNTNEKPHRQNFTSHQNRILSDWFFTHCDKPYPSTEDTKELSVLSGLTYSQVKKWFANKRARSSVNNSSHRSYGALNTSDSLMGELVGNELCSISPSLESQKSYTNPLVGSLSM